MKYLNLGCGSRFHLDWTNIDFISKGGNVIAHNILNGIPFDSASFDVVYHSHLLEHFSRKDGVAFIKECFRVLKPGGVIRVVVPDLERIVREYLVQLEKALQGNKEAGNNYDWMMIELYDQTVRNYSGGEAKDYLSRDNIPNKEFVFSRIGQGGKNIHEGYLRSKVNVASPYIYNKDRYLVSMIKMIFSSAVYKAKLKSILFKDELKKMEKLKAAAALGSFRMGGEIHQWMYDRYSLGRLLADTGFVKIEVKTAFESSVQGWNDYQLDSINGTMYKPDSLFMEARKQ